MYDSDMEEDRSDTFNFNKNIDLYLDNVAFDARKTVMIADEHGFRSICGPIGWMPEIVKEINRVRSECIPIAQLDFPFSLSPLDVRNYMILASKEMGVKEVEIPVPYTHISRKDGTKVFSEIKSLSENADKHGITIRFFIDSVIDSAPKDFKTKLCRMMKTCGIDHIGLSSGFFKEGELSDEVLNIRDFKNKIEARYKVNLRKNINAEAISTYVKSGVDLIGLPYSKAIETYNNYKNLIISNL